MHDVIVKMIPTNDSFCFCASRAVADEVTCLLLTHECMMVCPHTPFIPRQSLNT